MATIQNYLNQIASAVYGKDVRQSIVDSISAINDDTEDFESSVNGTVSSLKSVVSSNTNRQDELEEKYNEQIANMTNDNPSLAEVVDARGDYDTLGERLDDIVSNLQYQFISKGQLREPVRMFQGWAHCVKYDENLNKMVGFVLSGTSAHSNTAPYYRVEIDPNSGAMSDYTEVILYDSDGETEYEDDYSCGYIGSFLILSDGTYMIIDYYQRIFTSSDHGYTFIFQQQLSLNGRTTYNNDFPFGATVLSTGRILAGNGGASVKETYYSDDNGATCTVITMGTNTGTYPFEPCFIEVGGGKVIQYARKSMNAYSGGTAWATKEAACYSVSEDYGETWTAFQTSKTILDMTAGNGQAVIKDGYVHFVYASRYRYTTDSAGNSHYGAMYYTYAKLDDAFEDNWNDPVQLEFGHWSDDATNICDIGYPSVMLDSTGNIIVVYYDSAEDETYADSANWRMLIGSPYVQPSPVSEESGSMTTAYPSGTTDSLLQNLYADLIARINDLILQAGGTPEDSLIAGTYPLMTGLVEWIDAGDENQWTDNVVASKINSGVTLYGWNTTAYKIDSFKYTPTKFANNMQNAIIRLALSDYGIEDAFTVDFVVDMCTNQNFIHIGSYETGVSQFGVLYQRNNNFNGYDKTAMHIAFSYNFSSSKYSLYYNGNLYESGTNTDISDYADSIIVQVSAYSTDGGKGDIRLYSRILSADEVKNNYKYAASKCEIGGGYF